MVYVLVDSSAQAFANCLRDLYDPWDQHKSCDQHKSPMDQNVEYPQKIQIATRQFYAENKPFVYEYQEAVRTFMCQTPTDKGLAGEVLMIHPVEMQGENWFVAIEGSLRDGEFQGRQSVFRTQENFWELGQHYWQVNKQASQEAVGQVPHAEWDSDWALQAETKVVQ